MINKGSLSRKAFAVLLSLAVAVTWMIPSFAVYADSEEPAEDQQAVVQEDADQAEAVIEDNDQATADAEAAEEETIEEVALEPETAEAEEAALAEEASGEVYVLMNIPYSAFYGAGSASVADVDAVTSATNKVGNYGKAGGSYHGEKATHADGAPVGKANDAKVQGVTWAVKASSLEEVKALGGKEATDDSKVTVATAGKGQTTVTDLYGYQALNEMKEYSYYVLSSEPSAYLELQNGKFVSGKDGAEKVTGAAVEVSYGTNWGDVQLAVNGIDATADKIINGVEFTTASGNKVGLYHLDQIWANNSLGWRVAATQGLDGTSITNIRYYCSVKNNSSEYTNYVYDYPVDVAISQVYTGEISAKFVGSNSIVLSGLPTDAKNVKAKAYYTSGGRNATYEYLTPMVVDPSDDDIDPESVSVTGGKLTFKAGSVTNKAGTTVSFGTPEEGKEYTVEASSENYIISKTTVKYNAAEAELNSATEAADAAKKAAAKITSDNYLAASVTAVNNAKKALDTAVKSGKTADITKAADALNKAVKAAKAKKAVTVKVKPTSKTLKAKTVKKKAQSFTLKATVSSKKKASFSKVSGNAKITVSKAGKVTVKKGLTKGTYKVKVKVKAASTAKIKALDKTITVTVKVK